MKTLKLNPDFWALVAATVVTALFIICVVLEVLHNTGRI